jgi:hypothetical protein
VCVAKLPVQLHVYYGTHYIVQRSSRTEEKGQMKDDRDDESQIVAEIRILL